MSTDACDLCKGEIRTRRYYEDDICWVADCETCRIPIIVLNHHGKATEWELGYMEGIVNGIFLFHGIRKEARKIQEHEHWHILNAKFLG